MRTIAASDVELVLDIGADLGEGPIWDAERGWLLFVDVTRGLVHAFDPASRRHREFDVRAPVGAVVCATDGDWILAAGRTFVRFDPASRRSIVLAAIDSGRTDTRLNDGAVDPRGRFWAGTMSLHGEAGQGTLYRLDPDGAVHAMLAPVTTSNGIDWSPDGRLMYYVDTRTRRIDVFDFDEETGTIAGQRVFADFAGGRGRPDGLVVDAAGGVWVALWEGSGLRRFAPSGDLDVIVELPVTLTTKCAFGGPTLEDLYVTTAAGRLTPAQRAAEPAAGGLFRLRPGSKGRVPHRFGAPGRPGSPAHR